MAPLTHIERQGEQDGQPHKRQRRCAHAAATLAESVLALRLSGPASALSTNQRQLGQALEKANPTKPRMLTTELRQESLVLNGFTTENRYTHVKLSAAQLRAMNLEVTQSPYIFPAICNEAGAGRMLRKGVSFRYIYLGNEGGQGGQGGQFDITPADCEGQR